MNAINQNQSVGICFEEAFLKFIKDLGHPTKSTKHTDIEYIADATIRDDSRSIFIEIKSHRTYPNETTKDTFKRICETSIKKSTPQKPSGLFHQWRRGIARCDHYFVFVGLYNKDADEHAQDVFNGDVLNNYHHYSLYWTWKGQMFWLTIPALEMFGLLAKHEGAFRSFISELCDLTSVYSEKHEEYNIDPRSIGGGQNDIDIGLEFDLSDCIYNYEDYQSDPSWETESVKKSNIQLDDDLPQLIEGVTLEKSDFQIIKDSLVLGKDIYETSILINKSKTYLFNIYQGNSSYAHPKFRAWRLWFHGLLIKSGQLDDPTAELLATKDRRIQELESKTDRQSEKIADLKQKIKDLKMQQTVSTSSKGSIIEKKSSHEEDLDDALKMVNRFERIVDNLLNQIEGNS
tara:strand:- start:221 stop:1429 length:1209 start_codon:yes stop_codon:yes gene_type:complete